MVWFRLLCCVLLCLAPGCAPATSNKPRGAADAAAGDVAASHGTPSDLTRGENQVVGLMGQFAYDKAAAACRRLVESKDLPLERKRKLTVDLAIALLNRRQEGDLQESARLLDQMIETDPPDLRARYCRALLYFNAGQTSAAEALFRDVARADPTDSYAVYYVGQCLFLAGEYQQALDNFIVAIDIDPYLRSAYYGAFQAAQRLQQPDAARETLGQFQKLATNPRARLAELKYTRMGPKAEVFAAGASAAPRPAPQGPLFAQAEQLLLANGDGVAWQSGADPNALPNITVADIDGDGWSDLFIATACAGSEPKSPNAVLLQKSGGFELRTDHPLAQVSGVQTALWGDYDNDGQTDVYLCRRGPNQLWRRQSAGQWSNVTEETGAAGGDWNTVDGACFDADHDGDLDYLLANRNGPHQLLNNDRNGGFRLTAEQLRIAGTGAGARQVLVADLDADDDADLVFINQQPPHDVFINDRFWNYHPAAGFDALTALPLLAAAASDSDVDGQVELFTLAAQGILLWQPDATGKWVAARLATDEQEEVAGANGTIALLDVDGDARQEIFTASGGAWKIRSLDGRELAGSRQLAGAPADLLATAIWQQQHGPALLGFRPQAAPQVWQPGAGRHQFVLFSLSGRTDKAAEMRSNASGIGVQGAARIGANWTAVAPVRPGSGPGQSLQPATLGLAGAEQVDFLRLLWPDGVSQSELDLQPGKLLKIAETQRQAGSCPLVFAWDGEQFVFVADLLGAGGIGFNLGRGEYYDPRPHERLLLPAELLQQRDARYVIKLGEPMEEICYFDALRLVAYDIPPGWQLTLDERFAAADPLPTGAALFFQELILPTQASNDRGQDITQQVRRLDKRAAPLDRQDHRFIGLADQRTITLDFAVPLETLVQPTLVFDGWVEYAYSQTAFAAWQAGQEYSEPTVEVRGDDGVWHVVAPRFGYMAGTPRQSTLPLDRQQLPSACRQLRISTNMQIYWDRLAMVDAGKTPQFERQELKLAAACVADVGFSTRTFLDQRYTVYDYSDRPPLADARHPAGFYTRLGDALELVERRDDAVAIIGPGEELHLEFTPAATDPPPGWQRRYVLEADGWCKDADLFTKDAGTVEPLPRHPDWGDKASLGRRQELHRKYNTRFKSGY